MKAQADLDQVIEQRLSEGKPLVPGEETVLPLLAAARMLVQLQRIAIPPEFARHLEVSLRARMRQLSWQERGESSPPPVSRTDPRKCS